MVVDERILSITFSTPLRGKSTPDVILAVCSFPVFLQFPSTFESTLSQLLLLPFFSFPLSSFSLFISVSCHCLNIKISSVTPSFSLFYPLFLFIFPFSFIVSAFPHQFIKSIFTLNLLSLFILVK